MKVLITDDHSIVREGLKQIVRKIDAISIAEEAVNGNDALEKIKKNKYDLVIMDISMPDKSGLDILKILKDKNEKIKVLMLSIHPQEQFAIRALKLGAYGYLCKDSVYEELETAIKTILAGGKYISSALAEKLFFNTKNGIYSPLHEKLSEREFQIMCKLVKGVKVKEIAEELNISNKTVSTHRMRILEKMCFKNNAELTNYAIKNDLIE